MHVTGEDLVLRIEAVEDVFPDPSMSDGAPVRIDIFNPYLWHLNVS